MIPGPLFVVGGGDTPAAAVDAFLSAAGAAGPIIVVGQVREEPARAASSVQWLQERGAARVILWDAAEPGPADRLRAEAELRAASGVYIPGGNQSLVLDRWGADWCRTHFGLAHRRGAPFFGTSAGAMLMSRRMISGYGTEHHISETRPGFGLTELIIDTHYRERTRQGRLAHATRLWSAPGLGLSESEWRVVHGGKVWAPAEWSQRSAL